MFGAHRSLLAVLLAAAAPLVLPAGVPAQSSDGVELKRCPGTFHVLHTDRVGGLRLPAGIYGIAVAGEVTCAQAARRFTGFLQDWDGRLPSPWRVVAAAREFTRGDSGDLFQVTRATAPAGSRSCPTFTVLDDDRIGEVRLAAGRYRMTLLSGRLSCSQAARDLRGFLDEPSGLPSPWTAQVPRTGDVTFRRGATSSYGFRVRRAFSDTSGGGSYPATGRTRCPGVFRVLNDDRIGALRIPRGPHHVTVFGGVTCPQAVDALRVFLGRPSGDLPSPWRLRAATASFVRGTTGAKGFWIDRAYG